MITITYDTNSEYQFIRTLMAVGECDAASKEMIDRMNGGLDTPLIPYKTTITYKQSDSYIDDLTDHIIEKGETNESTN